MTKVLVTGGNGFIGQYVCENLEKQDIEPVVFDRHVPQSTKYETALGDTRDFTAVMEAIGKTDGFIHLAGVLGTQETIEEPEPAVMTNIIGGLNVFRAAKRYGRRGVYIAVGNHWMNNTYSISKTTAERFAFMYNAEHGTEIAVVRALNAYGPRQKPAPVKKIMPNFILPALEKKPIQIYGDGDQVMDMIYVQDVAEVLVRALLVNHGVYDSVFEAGTGRKTTVNDIARTVISEVRLQGIVNESGNLVDHIPMRPGEPEHSTVLGNPETLAPLRFFPSDLTTLEDGVKETVAYYRIAMTAP